MKLKIALAVLLPLGLLAGCASGDPTASPTNSSSATASPTESASPSESSSELPVITPGRVPDATKPEDFDLAPDYNPAIEVTPVQAAIIARNSFQLFDEQGVVETFDTNEGTFVMVHNPDQKDSYMAAWFDEQTGKGDLIFDAHEFTSAWPYLIINEPEIADSVYFAPAVGGFTLQVNDATFGPYGYTYTTDGRVLTSASWLISDENGTQRLATVNFKYSVSDEWKQRLDQTVEEFLADMDDQ
jgi:hypothetical protein